MATYQPPTFRDFGLPIPVQWIAGTYVVSPTPVTVHGGSFASYTSGGIATESFDIDIDSLGVVTIASSTGLEASAADWVLTINGLYFAAFGVNPAFVDAFGFLALQAVSRIVVSNYLDTGVGPGDVAYGVIGLPVVDRDVGAPSAFQPDRTPSVQGVSLPIVVPRGANVVAVTPNINGADPAYEAAVDWGLCLSDPSGPDPNLNIGLIEGLAFVDGAFTPIAPPGYITRAYGGDAYVSPFVVSSFLGAPYSRFEFRLPYGGEIRVWAAAAIAGASTPLPQANPFFAAFVRFSAR